MDLWKSLSGMVKIQITTASVALLLTRISNAGINLLDVNTIDDFTINATVARRNYYRLKELLEKNGETIKIVSKIGLFWHVDGLKKRKLLIIAIGILLFLTIWETLSYFQIIDSFFFSSPSRICLLFIAMCKNLEIFIHTGITLFETILSVLIVNILSILISILLFSIIFVF